MTLSLAELRQRGGSVDVAVQSIEGSIYRVVVLIDGSEWRLVEEDGTTFQRKSVSHIREALAGIAIGTMTLRQQSAYDEMIGQANKAGSNTLEVPLASGLEWPPV